MTTIHSKKRPPIIAVMGHIDHGKSTLLDYIRHTNVVAKEAGGITQRMSAYKVKHTDSNGNVSELTFLDTPGHEAFKDLRSRGAKVADIAILVVAADEGIKPQTLEALNAIKAAKLPFIVAMNKMDRPGANAEKLKQNLAEHEVYVEGYGGDVPAVPISALKGDGVSDLLDVITLLAELQDLKASENVPAEGIIIEAHSSKTKGVSAVAIIRNGILKQGDAVVSEDAWAPLRLIEDFQGKKIDCAYPSDPVRITGWNILPPLGSIFSSCSSKKECEEKAEEFKSNKKREEPFLIEIKEGEPLLTIPVIIKAETTDVLEAIVHEMKKLHCERVCVKVISAGVGYVSEADVKMALGKEGTIIVGFDAKVDAAAKSLAERSGVVIKTFDIIYKLTEWLQELVNEKTPKIMVEELKGKAKVLKFFSKTKDKQVIGGRVEEGEIAVGEEIKIMRRGAEIGRGRIRELQQSKVKTSEVREGLEFGTLIESKIELAPGDILEAYASVEK